LFNRIADGILEHDYDGYFMQKRSASGALGLHPLQKMIAAMRMLTYGIAADVVDEYIRSAEANHIANGILEHDYDGYFMQKRSASGALGLHPLQKMTAAMQMLTYRIVADGVDEYIRSAEATNLESCKKFVIKVCEVFGEKYLRSPNEEDIARLLAIGEERGFLGMLGSIDCMHWGWKNCPKNGMACLEAM
jgi:hypothetical protein